MEGQQDQGLTHAALAAGAGPPKRPPGRPRNPGETYERARTRKEIALADKREDDVKKARGKLLDADEVERARADENRMIKSGLLAVPSRFRARCPHLTPADLAILDEEIRAALRALGEAE